MFFTLQAHNILNIDLKLNTGRDSLTTAHVFPFLVDRTGQRLHSGGHNGSNEHLVGKMNDRGSVIGHSPGAGVVAKKGQRVDSSSGHGAAASNAAPLGGVQSHHSTTQSAKVNHL